MDIERLAMEGMDKGYALIIAGDFNLSLERGDRGAIMAEFCEQFSMNIVNDQDSAEAWTFKSFIGGFYRLDYILHTKNLRSFDVSANYDLDLGSDHRNVSASLEFIRSQESWKKLNVSWDSQEYHQYLQQTMDESMSSTLHELGQVAIRTTEV